MYGLVLLLTGRTTESLEVSARNRSSPPLKHYHAQLVWSVYMRSSLAAGHDLPGVEAWAQRAYTDASNVSDQAASGVTAIRVGVALGERDVDGAAAWRARLLDLLGPGGTAPAAMAGFARLAESWAALAETDLQSAQRVALAGAASPVDAAQLLYEVLRAGAPPSDIAPLLSEIAARTDAPFASAFAEHARSLAAGDGRALTAIADAFEALGARRYACEAAAHAATAFAAEGRMDSARRLATRARTLHLEGALPQMTGVDPNSVQLTRRETQFVELASRGQSNQEIAERLVLSVRTVESHLYRAMQKLGVSDRRDL
jgi:DNA-binding NarL/FixJ family response regulator